MSISTMPVFVNGVLDCGLYDFERGIVELACELAFNDDIMAAPALFWDHCITSVNENTELLFKSDAPNPPLSSLDDPDLISFGDGDADNEPLLTRVPDPLQGGDLAPRKESTRDSVSEQGQDDNDDEPRHPKQTLNQDEDSAPCDKSSRDSVIEKGQDGKPGALKDAPNPPSPSSSSSSLSPPPLPQPTEAKPNTIDSVVESDKNVGTISGARRAPSLASRQSSTRNRDSADQQTSAPAEPAGSTRKSAVTQRAPSPVSRRSSTQNRDSADQQTSAPAEPAGST